MENVLLYGSECCRLTVRQQKRLDGRYTRLLRACQNISWRQRITNKVLYDGLPPVSEILRARRLGFAGHCFRAKDECISNILLWKPAHGKRKVGGRRSCENLHGSVGGVTWRSLLYRWQTGRSGAKLSPRTDLGVDQSIVSSIVSTVISLYTVSLSIPCISISPETTFSTVVSFSRLYTVHFSIPCILPHFSIPPGDPV